MPLLLWFVDCCFVCIWKWGLLNYIFSTLHAIKLLMKFDNRNWLKYQLFGSHLGLKLKLFFWIDPSCTFNPALTCVNFSIGKAAFISEENIATILSFLLLLKKDTNFVDTFLLLPFSVCELAELNIDKKAIRRSMFFMDAN